ncbi:alpha/beta hydrolase [Streptomyces sp. OF3]|uniref:Alpha/beta hydrolase n=2 Tax=Streptomyces alkaliterrae TaxID=2213162 RepID=A0A7W3ZNJ2_9ACTN|nr:alpha/beta hydrolase [Streptomyces alkaliterrae]MBB1254994.1 alpha/beta hydrolase [Streptomyces alkaliterrae]
MDLVRLTVEPDPSRVVDTITRLFEQLAEHPRRLPADAHLDPVLPASGRVAGDWVSAGRPGSADDGVVLYVHGGGFVLREPELMNLFAHRISSATGRPVFALHYRLAPRHPYPAPLDDVLTAYRWLLGHGVPAERISVIGESSGGALVLSALQLLRDEGAPPPASVALLSPVTDLSVSGTSVDTNGRVHDPGVDRSMLTRLIGQYLGDARPDAAPQSPLHGDPSGLPPLLFAVGTGEALLDDSVRFAEAADAAGVRTRVDGYESLIHGFQLLTLLPDNPTGRMFLDRVARWLLDAVGAVADPVV